MNMSLKKQLAIISGVAIASILLLILTSFLMMKKVALGSELHKQMVGSRELIIEIAPPALFLLEPVMMVYQSTSLNQSEMKKQGKIIKRKLNDFSKALKDWQTKPYLIEEQKQFIRKDLTPQGEAMVAYIENSIFPLLENGDAEQLNFANRKLSELFEEHHLLIDKLANITQAEISASIKESSEAISFYRNLLISICLLSSSLMVLVSVYFANNILKGLGVDPQELKRITSAVAIGNLDVNLGVINSDGSVMNAVADMLTSIRAGMAVSVENYRVKQALSSTSSNVMMADNNRTIIYMNKALETMLRRVESDFRRALPHFSMDKIIGGSMDVFHSNPSHQSHLLANLRETYVGNIVVAGLSFRLIASPIFNEKSERLGTVVEWVDRTKEVAAEHELSRILGALETTTTNVMIADNDRNIIYLNKSVETMLRIAEADIKSVLPHFSIDNVLGSNMDIFHKNPAHQMKLLETLTAAYTVNIVVGKRYFRLIANPIFSKDGSRLGSVVEWLDRTQEVAVESEVNHVVQAAGAGNFKARIPIEGKVGFFLTLAEGLNALMQTSDVGLGEVNRVLSAIAKGDLTEKITSDYAGTFGELKDYCNSTTANLSDIIGEIRAAAETIFTASREIAQGNSDFSGRTEQQAANLEETASSMEELTSTVKLNADNAKQANILAEQASAVASDGGALIQQVVVTMSSINESSQKIADIIGVIDGIAFQTNILALNAAVEAARAGDQGRGFAVVASEVRTLAQRSANAAKDIKALISDSVKKIENGNSLVGKSGDTMKEIVTAIKRVNDIMAEIAAASVEQSAGIDEVSTAVSHMDEMTQQNAALVEEAAAAAESLQSQADQLTQRVSKFRLNNDSLYTSRQPAARLSLPKSTAKPSALAKKISSSMQQNDEWESF